MTDKWGSKNLHELISYNLENFLEAGKIKNLMVFAEDPLGCALDFKKVQRWFNKIEFLLVQDYFMTDTAKEANIILPASLPFESGGTYTNTQRIIQKFEKIMTPKIELNSCEQLIHLLEKFNQKGLSDVIDVMMEAITMLPQIPDEYTYTFKVTENDDQNRLFDFGCDNIVKYFDEGFRKSFKN
jgi:formate dehydrogenase major subunit